MILFLTFLLGRANATIHTKNHVMWLGNSVRSFKRRFEMELWIPQAESLEIPSWLRRLNAKKATHVAGIAHGEASQCQHSVPTETEALGCQIGPITSVWVIPGWNCGIGPPILDQFHFGRCRFLYVDVQKQTQIFRKRWWILEECEGKKNQLLECPWKVWITVRNHRLYMFVL